jgi:hypothetical protein
LNSNNECNNTNYSKYEYHRIDKNSNGIDNTFIQMDELNNNSDETEPNKLLIDRKSPTSIAATVAFSSSITNLNGNNRHYSTREIKFIVFYFGIRILITSIIWNHFVHKYHDLLMVFSNNPIKRVYFIYILSKFSLIYLNQILKIETPRSSF